MTIGKWADCVGHPSGAALKAAGFAGIFLYVGTPGRAKNATGPIYRDYLLSGLQVACVYENTADDISSGAGAAHAEAAVADMRSMGMPETTPLAAAADQHLAAGQIPTAVSYQAQFHAAARNAGWVGPIGGYGFSEFTHAVSIAGVAEWLWQCGSASALWPGVTFWQRNTGTTTVAGVQVDINDQLLPIMEDDLTPEQDTLLRDIHEQLCGQGARDPGQITGWAQLDGKTLVDGVADIPNQVWGQQLTTPGWTDPKRTAAAGVIVGNADAHTKQIIDAIGNVAVSGVDVEALATALTAALGPEVAKAIGQKLVS